MIDKRNLAILGCKTRYEMLLVLRVLEGDYDTKESNFTLNENAFFPKNTIFDKGTRINYYYNWHSIHDKDAYNKCEKLTYKEFRERFKDDIREIESIKSV